MSESNSFPPMADRVRGFGTTIFAEMSALAAENDAVNLGQGAPDFNPPESVCRAVYDAIEAGHNQYAVSRGQAVLREAIAGHAARFYGQSVNPASDVTVTTGATEALVCAAFGFIEPCDEVIVFEPTYDTYVPAITMAGGAPVAVQLRAPEFRFNPDELRAAVTERTRAIFVNTPHNPTGTVFTHDELSFIAELCVEHDLLAITDEVYEHIVYPGHRHHRLATFPGMWDRTLTISSAGKTFNCTGWKVGWCIAPEPLQVAIRRVHQYAVYATTTPMQFAIAAALGMPDEYFAELRDDYIERRDYLMGALRKAGFHPKQPEGTYYIVCSIEHTGFERAAEFARHLVENSRVASIPLESFYVDPTNGRSTVRFCFCKTWDALHEAERRLLAYSEQ